MIGYYGKLLIAAYILFCTSVLGFIFMCMVLGRKGNKTPSSMVRPCKK